MDKYQTQIFIFFTAVVVLILVAGIIAFVFQYRRRRIQHIRETEQLTQKHLQELLAQQLEMKKQTMEFIGAEIHDSVGQKLTLASLYLQQLWQQNNVADSSGRLQAVNTILNETLAELRNLSRNLTDENRQNHDLETLLQQECERVNASGICTATLTAHTAGSQLQPQQKNVLLRIVQEFLQNSLKYSGCTTIKVTMGITDNVFRLTASDDGEGFDMEAAAINRKGIGISNIRRRAGSIGAGLTLFSAEGQGTKLELHLNV